MTDQARMDGKAGKGEKDGLCNRTACQSDLRGRPQWYMIHHSTKAKVFYCQPCAFQFNDWDDRCREPRRCTREPAQPKP